MQLADLRPADGSPGERQVAVKTLRAELLAEPGQIELFVKEVELLRKLRNRCGPGGAAWAPRVRGHPAQPGPRRACRCHGVAGSRIGALAMAVSLDGTNPPPCCPMWRLPGTLWSSLAAPGSAAAAWTARPAARAARARCFTCRSTVSACMGGVRGCMDVIGCVRRCCSTLMRHPPPTPAGPLNLCAPCASGAGGSLGDVVRRQMTNPFKKLYSNADALRW